MSCDCWPRKIESFGHLICVVTGFDWGLVEEYGFPVGIYLPGHKLLNFLLRIALKKRKYSRPQLAISSADEISLRFHKLPAGKAVCLLYAICDPTGNRTRI